MSAPSRKRRRPSLYEARIVHPALLQRAEYLGLAPWHADLKYVSDPWTDQGLDEFSIARVVGVHL